MTFHRAGRGHFEASYTTDEDLLPSAQEALGKALEEELATRRLSVLFVVEHAAIPRSVPEFWLKVTAQLAPRFCAMAIVSSHLSVRSAATAFSVTNRLRSVKLAVKAFTPAELETARKWCSELREAAPGQ